MSFEMVAGDSKRINFTLLDATTGGALDITGAVARWQVSRMKGEMFSPTPTLMKSMADGIEVTDEFGGLLTVTLKPSDTVSLFGDFYHELELIDATGDVATVYTGTFTIKRALIRPISG
jgi:hypothetical protein